MRRLRAYFALALTGCLGGCSPGGLSEEAGDGLASGIEEPRLRALTCVTPAAQGDPEASSAQREGLERLNCHRDLMGLAPTFLSAELSAAAQAHAEYIAATDEYGHIESDSGHAAFTGVDASERVRAQGVEIDPLYQALMEVVSYHSEGADAAVSIDDWIDSVYHRAPLAIPELSRVGIGSATVFDVMEIVAPWQGDEDVHVAKYPGDGQRGVPTSFDSDRESPDPAPLRGVVGYPVTLSFLVREAGGGTNPYGIDVDRDATVLEGPSGPVPCDVLQPADDDILMRTVALLPHEPLTEGTSYTATVVVDLPTGPVEETWSFTTSR